MQYPNIWVITATCGRVKCLERSISCFLHQDYPGEHTMLIFNNSKFPLQLGNIATPENKHIILVNNHLNTITKEPYTSLGEIYNDILNFIPDGVDLVVHGDDDDMYLDNHLSKGAEGIQKSGKLAYKPSASWYLHAGGCELMVNTMEPSIFIDAKFLKEIGYNSGKNVSHHLKWVHELMTREAICSDPEGEPTLLYTWGIDDVFKTSGAGETEGNFQNYRNYSRDFTNKPIMPASRSSYIHFLNLTNKANAYN